MKKPILVFSDLDGTLLDYHTYDFEAARPALELIKKLGLPLILISSKTRAELEKYRRMLEVDEYPFVTENGAGVFFNRDYFRIDDVKTVENWFQVKVFGSSFHVIKAALETISAKTGIDIKGFHNATVQTIMKKTALDEESAKLAMQREYSIPVFYDDDVRKVLETELSEYGLQIIYGGRFMHVVGKADKGNAVRWIISAYRRKINNSDLFSIGVGDSLNDFPMLRAVDIPILVKRHNGAYESREILEKAVFSRGIGPCGWNETMMDLLGNGGQNE